MRTDPRPEEVRELVKDILGDFCQPASEEWDLDETILIDGGRLVARSYRTEGYLAMWLVEVGIVQFYDADGQMLVTVNLFESLRPQRLAA